VESCGLDSSESGHGLAAGCVNTVMNFLVPQKTRNFLTR
jgi:hypothetical protein